MNEALIVDAWSYRHNLQLADSLYAALSDQRAIPMVTTDRGMVAAISRAEHPVDQ